MKKVLFTLAFAIFSLIVKAQYSTEVVLSTQRNSYLVGSLPPESGSNYAKLQIDILGGDWTEAAMGVTTFYVANRDVLTIHQVTQGSGADNYTIKAYANPNGNIDIYIINTQDYPAFTMKSCMLEGNSTVLQTIVQQTPVGTDVTPAVVPVFITDANGNISINTTSSAGYKFAVNGSAIATSMTVKPNGNWPDYVFKKDFQLPSLADVKSFIDQNQHLPEMPSAQEVAKDGLNLGEMNKLLMKKVEELTLYLIEQNKRIEKLESQLKTLKNEQ